MQRFLASPRRRRRLKWVLAACVVVAAIVLPILLVPQPPQPSVAPPRNAPKAQAVAHSTYVSPAERRAIDSVLDRFLPAALPHSSMATAWRLAGPELKGGTTLREWLHGTSPIPYYPVAGKTFHDWTTIDAGPGYVTFNLLVHPRRGAGTKSAWVFSGEVIRGHSGWLVNRLYTIALFAPPTKSGRHEVGPADFAAGAPSGGTAPLKHGIIAKQWLIAVVAVIALVVLFPLGFFLASILRARRLQRRYRRPREEELPPLPSSFRTAASKPEEQVPAGPRH